MRNLILIFGLLLLMINLRGNTIHLEARIYNYYSSDSSLMLKIIPKEYLNDNDDWMFNKDDTCTAMLFSLKDSDTSLICTIFLQNHLAPTLALIPNSLNCIITFGNIDQSNANFLVAYGLDGEVIYTYSGEDLRFGLFHNPLMPQWLNTLSLDKNEEKIVYEFDYYILEEKHDEKNGLILIDINTGEIYMNEELEKDIEKTKIRLEEFDKN